MPVQYSFNLFLVQYITGLLGNILRASNDVYTLFSLGNSCKFPLSWMSQWKLEIHRLHSVSNGKLTEKPHFSKTNNMKCTQQWHNEPNVVALLKILTYYVYTFFEAMITSCLALLCLINILPWSRKHSHAFMGDWRHKSKYFPNV